MLVRSIIQKKIRYAIENWKITLHFLTHRILYGCVIRDAVFRQSLCLTETIYTLVCFGGHYRRLLQKWNWYFAVTSYTSSKQTKLSIADLVHHTNQRPCNAGMNIKYLRNWTAKFEKLGWHEFQLISHRQLLFMAVHQDVYFTNN